VKTHSGEHAKNARGRERERVYVRVRYSTHNWI
jgi:hypothetical protein